MNSLNTSFRNVDIISKHIDQHAEAFDIVKENGAGYLIKKNGYLKELLLRVKHAFRSNAGRDYQEKLKTIIESDVQNLNLQERSIFVKEEDHNAFTDIFIAAQRYNHALQLHKNPDLKKETVLFEELSLVEPINPKSCPEAAPIEVKIQEIIHSKLEDIPKNQKPYTYKKGKRKKFYHYNEKDKNFNHGQEALHIFLNTQRERLLSFIGRIIEKVASILKQKVNFFNRYHYFRNSEDKDDKVYAKDQPLALTEHPTSYWVGHATTLLSIPHKTENGESISVNMITDPVEGDLHKILYPRMTKPGRPIANCPVPHIYMLSHNHLDHLDKKTIKGLKKYQPIMLVPKGDAQKFRRLGFKNIYEHNWWHTTTIPIQQGDKKALVKITSVPANHWSGGAPGTAHKATTVGYVIHRESGDIYFAGDTARLSEEHIATLRERFDIHSMFQPGGPDEMRKHMKSTHQASSDGLWMHLNLVIRNLYEKGNYAAKSKDEFVEEAKKMRTLYMHTKTFKLGNLHFDDTDQSVKRVKEALQTGKISAEMRDYEEGVYHELLELGKKMHFSDGRYLDAQDISKILEVGVIIPKIGSRTEL